MMEHKAMNAFLQRIIAARVMKVSGPCVVDIRTDGSFSIDLRKNFKEVTRSEMNKEKEFFIRVLKECGMSVKAYTDGGVECTLRIVVSDKTRELLDSVSDALREFGEEIEQILTDDWQESITK